MAEPTEVWAVIAADGFIIGAFGNRSDAEKHAKYCTQLKPLAPPCTYCRYVVSESAKAEAQPAGTGWVKLTDGSPSIGSYAVFIQPGKEPVVHRVEGTVRGPDGTLVFQLPSHQEQEESVNWDRGMLGH